MPIPGPSPSTPAVLPYAPCGWVPTAIPGSPCCNPTTDPAIVTQANGIASALIFALTGRQFGACSVTVRPCKPKTCDPLTLAQVIYWDSRPGPLGLGAAGNLGVLSYFPTLVGGEVFNIACGCPTGCCKCEADCEVLLPGPIASISDVTVDGVTLDPAHYRVVDGNTLVFATGFCPGCQDYNLPAGNVGTWTVTYAVGTPVPAELNFAAGLYAQEIAKSLIGDKSCSLPERVMSVTRSGVTTQFFDPTSLLNNGLTGLTIVDQIIKATNPAGLTQPPRVWFPGRSRTRRDT